MPSARSVLQTLRKRGLRLAVAESFTGGLLQDALTDVPGASRAFVGGVVAYDDAVKLGLLGVPAGLIRAHGAVSEPVALAMARGARRRLKADVAVATTGIAGPTGARPGKPVGTSVVAVVWGRRARFERRVLLGGRRAVKEAAVRQALGLLEELLRSPRRPRNP